MRKKEFLQPLHSEVLGYFYFFEPKETNYTLLATEFGISRYLTQKVLSELCEKHWIIKKRTGKKMIITLAKKLIPKYVSDEIERAIETGCYDR